MYQDLPKRRTILRILLPTTAVFVLPCILHAQDSNRRRTTLTSSEEEVSSGPVTDVDTELALQQAASQHPAVYCDFILTLLEKRTSYLREKRFTDELPNVLAKATATDELAPFYAGGGTVRRLECRALRA